jgi:hypothetical protein
MITNELIHELQANKIKESVCLILPPNPVEGALCLLKTSDSNWRIILNERGEYLINRNFQSEDDACRFFLKKALLEPTYREDFTPALLQIWPSKKRELIERYAFDVSED